MDAVPTALEHLHCFRRQRRHCLLPPPAANSQTLPHTQPNASGAVAYVVPEHTREAAFQVCECCILLGHACACAHLVSSTFRWRLIIVPLCSSSSAAGVRPAGQHAQGPSLPAAPRARTRTPHAARLAGEQLLLGAEGAVELPGICCFCLHWTCQKSMHMLQCARQRLADWTEHLVAYLACRPLWRLRPACLRSPCILRQPHPPLPSPPLQAAASTLGFGFSGLVALACTTVSISIVGIWALMGLTVATGEGGGGVWLRPGPPLPPVRRMHALLGCGDGAGLHG